MNRSFPVHILIFALLSALPIAAQRRHDPLTQLEINQLRDAMLDPDHALRPAKPAKRRIGHGIGLAAVGDDSHMVQIVRIVGMEHRPVGDRRGQIRRIAATDRLHE